MAGWPGGWVAGWLDRGIGASQAVKWHGENGEVNIWNTARRRLEDPARAGKQPAPKRSHCSGRAGGCQWAYSQYVDGRGSALASWRHDGSRRRRDMG